MDKVNNMLPFIEDYFSKAKERNPSFSMRAFAKQLDVSPSYLSEILSGKREITLKLAEKISEKLSLSPKDVKKIFSKYEYFSDRTTTKVAMDQYHLISTWYHFAILSLAETEDFQSCPIWIAKRLNIKRREAKDAIERLIRMDLLEVDSSGAFSETGISLTTTDEVNNLSLRKTHLENLDLAKESLNTDSLEMRDFTAITMAVSPEKMPQAKRMIREFRDHLCQFMESGKKEEVYKMCIQLFPLSKSTKDQTK